MTHPFLSRSLARVIATAGCLAVGAIAPAARAGTAAQLASAYASGARSTPSPSRGEQFFTVVHGREWSCASCHGAMPTQAGRHAVTGKAIATLAPAFNPERFTDPAKVEKWFRRNCNDVAGRDCSAAEKADVIAWLMTLKP